MLSMVKMLLKGAVGDGLTVYKIVIEITLLIMENHGKIGIVILNFCGNPEFYDNPCSADHFSSLPGLEGQSVVSLIADPGVMSLIPAWPHLSWRLIMFSVVILLLPLIQEGLL